MYSNLYVYLRNATVVLVISGTKKDPYRMMFGTCKGSFALSAKV